MRKLITVVNILSIFKHGSDKLRGRTILFLLNKWTRKTDTIFKASVHMDFNINR